jgi:6,7-dimethyl-8-ribityllumazine synthase
MKNDVKIKIAIIVSEFNKEISDNLLNGSLEVLNAALNRLVNYQRFLY